MTPTTPVSILKLVWRVILFAIIGLSALPILISADRPKALTALLPDFSNPIVIIMTVMAFAVIVALRIVPLIL